MIYKVCSPDIIFDFLEINILWLRVEYLGEPPALQKTLRTAMKFK